MTHILAPCLLYVCILIFALVLLLLCWCRGCYSVHVLPKMNGSSISGRVSLFHHHPPPSSILLHGLHELKASRVSIKQASLGESTSRSLAVVSVAQHRRVSFCCWRRPRNPPRQSTCHATWRPFILHRHHRRHRSHSNHPPLLAITHCSCFACYSNWGQFARSGLLAVFSSGNRFTFMSATNQPTNQPTTHSGGFTLNVLIKETQPFTLQLYPVFYFISLTRCSKNSDVLSENFVECILGGPQMWAIFGPEANLSFVYLR